MTQTIPGQTPALRTGPAMEDCDAAVASAAKGFAARLQRLNPDSGEFVPDVVRLILSEARAARASDVHLVPGESHLVMQWRIDGVLHAIAGFDSSLSARVIARLKVISGLLTYRTDVPQEGRVAREHSQSEVRITTFPTLYGEKAAIRLFAENADLQRLSQLGLPEDVERELHHALDATSGVILLTGPSGSGKTTTAYACLRDVIAKSGGARCVMTLEDPIEVAVSGATQSQVRPSAGFDLTTGLRSLMRQDPDVILVGEIRDPATAEAAFQAALTGHLVITTFHAGSAAEAVTRLLEMQIEPYLLRSGLRVVICQRLLRRLEQAGGSAIGEAGSAMQTKFQKGPDKTDGELVLGTGEHAERAGYFGRMVLAELMNPDKPDIVDGILSRCDAIQLEAAAVRSGMQTLRQAAGEAVARRLTSREEVLRVFGSQ